MVESLNRSRAVRAHALAAAAGLLVASCASGADIPAPSYATSSPETQRTYRLGIGDKLKIVVFGEENLSGQFEVNALGQVSIPLVGEVPAADRPISEFREAIGRKLASGYLKNPRVTVEVLNYRPIYIHGEVKSGGEFPFKSGLRLRDAIALAGGYTYRANQSYVAIFREGEGELNVPMSGAFAILPGDNIRVPERFF
ncbi:MAG: polysaccharide biosynthesis/export family protein [Hyphomicrobiaceae bacterium]